MVNKKGRIGGVLICAGIIGFGIFLMFLAGVVIANDSIDNSLAEYDDIFAKGCTSGCFESYSLSGEENRNEITTLELCLDWCNS